MFGIRQAIQPTQSLHAAMEPNQEEIAWNIGMEKPFLV